MIGLEIMTYRDIVSTNQMTGGEATDLPVDGEAPIEIGFAPCAFFTTLDYGVLELIMVVELTR